MRVDFLLEEESAEAALSLLMPRLLPGCACRFRAYRGVQTLLKNLPELLRGYAQRILREGESDLRVVVLLDADGIAERRMQELEDKAAAAGLSTKSSRLDGQPFYVFNSLAVQELESWFLGDRAAMVAAYPNLRPHHFGGLKSNPDNIAAAWEALWRILQKGRYYLDGRAKVEWAATIAPHLEPARNTSPSFQYFCAGLAALR